MPLNAALIPGKASGQEAYATAGRGISNSIEDASPESGRAVGPSHASDNVAATLTRWPEEVHGGVAQAQSERGTNEIEINSKPQSRLSLVGAAVKNHAGRTAATQQRITYRFFTDPQLQLQTFWLLIYFSALGLIFGWRFQQYSRGPRNLLFGWSLPIAKACGNAMKIVIWPVLILPLNYVFTTQLRHTFLNRILPFDNAISFHRMVATIGGIMAVIHTICHTIDYAHAGKQPAALWRAAFPDDPQCLSFWQLMNQESTYTGIGMLTTLTVMFSFAMPFPRKFAWLKSSGVGKVLNNFNWFWATHKIGGGIFYLLVLMHPLPCMARNVENPFTHDASPTEWGCSDTWVYITLPIAIRLVDRSIRWWRRNNTGFSILRAEFLEDDLVALAIKKPPAFKFRPGMYVYLNIPSVAQHEWHPLSLAGPCSDENLSVMLRGSGDWASEVYQLLKAAALRPTPAITRLRPCSTADDSTYEDSTGFEVLSDLRIHVDGPFGAPAVAYSRYAVVLLVATGVGVTPFLSMLANAVEESAALDTPQSTPPVQGCCGSRHTSPKKLHFHWLVSKPAVPSCLQKTLEAAVTADVSGMLDLNVHMTRARSRAESFGCLKQAFSSGDQQVQLNVDAELGQVNSIKAWSGRPDFKQILADLELDNIGKNVGVFFCGNPNLGATLRTITHAATARRQTVFHFHMEQY